MNQVEILSIFHSRYGLFTVLVRRLLKTGLIFKW